MFGFRNTDGIHLRVAGNARLRNCLSDELAKQCERLNIGYTAMSGNCRMLICSLYASYQGHPNKFGKKRKAKTIFDLSSKVSSLILREIMRDVTFSWKLIFLSEKLRCSIGRVFMVKDYLYEQLWAQMSSDGLRILNPQAIMCAWSEAYSQKAASFEVLDCHTLMSISEFEERICKIRADSRLNCFLTGFAGGVRYTPVVRYTKVYLLVWERDIQTFLKAAACKPVDSGASISGLHESERAWRGGVPELLFPRQGYVGRVSSKAQKELLPIPS